MREILFRGKDYEGEWVQGDLVRNIDRQPIIGTAFLNMQKVIPETVGQYTGLTDKNGTKIFEGDICRVTRHCILCYGSITFKKGSFWFDEFNTDSVLELSKLEINNFEIKVIGNIHDNPELLRSEDK